MFSLLLLKVKQYIIYLPIWQDYRTCIVYILWRCILQQQKNVASDNEKQNASAGRGFHFSSEMSQQSFKGLLEKVSIFPLILAEHLGQGQERVAGDIFIQLRGPPEMENVATRQMCWYRNYSKKFVKLFSRDIQTH